MRQWWSKIEGAFGRRRNLANKLEQEIDAHLQFLIEENLKREWRLTRLVLLRDACLGMGRGAGEELSIVAVPEIRITASGYPLCIARDPEGAGSPASGDSDAGGRDRSK